MTLNGKHALITGGSRGIGRAIVLKLAGHGVRTAMQYHRNEEAARDTLIVAGDEGRRRGRFAPAPVMISIRW